MELPFVSRKKYNEVVYKLECLLCHATSGKLSKASYTLKTMETAVTDAFNESYDDGYRDAEQAVAKEIFDLFEDECLAYPIQEGHPTILVDARNYNALKKKYTEGASE